MKIIKEGKKIERTMRVFCKKCDAELEIEADDLTKFYIKFKYECPCCKWTNYLQSNDLTDEFLIELTNR